MKYKYLAICILLLFLIGCATKEQKKESTEEQAITQEEEKINEEQQQVKEEEQQIGQEQQQIEEEEKKIEEEQQIEEEQTEQPAIEVEKKQNLSEEEQIKQIFGYAKTKLQSYSYKYKGPTGLQYNIYVKNNKIMLASLSTDYKIYIDTQKKTAEEYCTNHPTCGKQTGKVADLDYSNSYIETPIDWLAKITKSNKIDEGFYYDKKSWILDTNIGEVTIDTNYGFIYNIKQTDKTYSFSDASFNVVQDSDVNPPEYLLPK